MATPRSLTWKLEPHTAAKHSIPRGYLDAYWPILLQSRHRRQLTYAEGFAGPNEYVGGEDGSPNHALAALMRHRRLLQPDTRINVVLVDERADRLKNCVRRIHERFPLLPPQVRISAHKGDCSETLPGALDAADAWNGPVFANLDPFGVDVPYELVQRIARHGRASEVFVTFNSDFFTRWARHEDVDAADRQFGNASWRAVDRIESQLKKRWLLDAYRARLGEGGFGYTLAFELLDRSHQLVLVHATSDIAGLRHMKDAMWRIDPVHGAQFRDPHDTQQLAIPIRHDPDLTVLDRLLDEHLTTKPRHLIDDLRDWATTETSFRQQHVDQLLKRRRNENELCVSPTRHIRAGNWVELKTSAASESQQPVQKALF